MPGRAIAWPLNQFLLSRSSAASRTVPAGTNSLILGRPSGEADHLGPGLFDQLLEPGQRSRITGGEQYDRRRRRSHAKFLEAVGDELGQAGPARGVDDEKLRRGEEPVHRPALEVAQVEQVRQKFAGSAVQEIGAVLLIKLQQLLHVADAAVEQGVPAFLRQDGALRHRIHARVARQHQVRHRQGPQPAKGIEEQFRVAAVAARQVGRVGAQGFGQLVVEAGSPRSDMMTSPENNTWRSFRSIRKQRLPRVWPGAARTWKRASPTSSTSSPFSLTSTVVGWAWACGMSNVLKKASRGVPAARMSASPKPA